MVVWNVIPWYIGTEKAIRGWKRIDLDEARDALCDLLDLLPNLRVVVLQGRAAQSAWDRLGVEMPVIRSPHPSPQNLNTRPEMRAGILDALLEAKSLASNASVPPRPKPLPSPGNRERVPPLGSVSLSDASGGMTAVADDVLRARVAELVAEGLGGDAIKAALRRPEHRVIELWAEERARLDGALASVEPTPANVVKVRETYTFGPSRNPTWKPRWEMVAAIIYGDASREYCSKAKALYERERGAGSSSRSYAGRGTRS